MESVKYEFVYIYFRLKCNLLPCSISLSLHDSAVHGPLEVHFYLAKFVSLYAKLHAACERDVVTN
jgi:hypothetical protein